jgi:hypothetical protein
MNKSQPHSSKRVEGGKRVYNLVIAYIGASGFWVLRFGFCFWLGQEVRHKSWSMFPLQGLYIYIYTERLGAWVGVSSILALE